MVTAVLPGCNHAPRRLFDVPSSSCHSAQIPAAPDHGMMPSKHSVTADDAAHHDPIGAVAMSAARVTVTPAVGM